MNKIINGKRYDTETAKKIKYRDNGFYTTDFDYYSETLYRKRTGEFFLDLDGGARSACAELDGTGGVCGGEMIRPLSDAEAHEWGEKNLTGDEYVAVFGKVEE